LYSFGGSASIEPRRVDGAADDKPGERRREEFLGALVVGDGSFLSPTSDGRSASKWVEQGGTVRTLITAAIVVAFATGASLAQTKHKVGEDGVKAPVLIKETKPKYTASAKARGVQGRVEVSAVILSTGSVGDVKVTQSLDSELDEQAVLAVKEWKFRPGTKDDKPVDVEVQIELTFTLK
jgi:protein TonB